MGKGSSASEDHRICAQVLAVSSRWGHVASLDSSLPAWRRRRGERGSAIIEAAFVTPVFLLLLFGILEYGLLFRDNLTTTNASQEAARAASIGGRSLEADYITLETLEHGIAAMGLEGLNYAVIFNATVLDGEIPDGHACHTQSVADVCNRYLPGDFAYELTDAGGNVTGYFRCTTSGDNLDGAWCPLDRRSGLGDDSDLIGVYVNTTHDYITGFFGESQILDATTVIRVEPDEVL